MTSNTIISSRSKNCIKSYRRSYSFSWMSVSDCWWNYLSTWPFTLVPATSTSFPYNKFPLVFSTCLPMWYIQYNYRLFSPSNSGLEFSLFHWFYHYFTSKEWLRPSSVVINAHFSVHRIIRTQIGLITWSCFRKIRHVHISLIPVVVRDPFTNETHT